MVPNNKLCSLSKKRNVWRWIQLCITETYNRFNKCVISIFNVIQILTICILFSYFRRQASLPLLFEGTRISALQIIDPDPEKFSCDYLFKAIYMVSLFILIFIISQFHSTARIYICSGNFGSAFQPNGLAKYSYT